MTELIPEEHQSTIDTEGNAETRESYCINNALLDCILAAPGKYQTRAIEKQNIQEEDDDDDQKQEEDDDDDDAEDSD